MDLHNHNPYYMGFGLAMDLCLGLGWGGGESVPVATPDSVHVLAWDKACIRHMLRLRIRVGMEGSVLVPTWGWGDQFSYPRQTQYIRFILGICSGVGRGRLSCNHTRQESL